MNPTTKDTAIKWTRFYCIIFLLPLTLLLCYIGKWRALPYCISYVCEISGIIYCVGIMSTLPLKIDRCTFYSNERNIALLHKANGIRIVTTAVTILTIYTLFFGLYVTRHEELLVKCVYAMISLLELWCYIDFFRDRHKLNKYVKRTCASKNFPKTFQ